MKTWFALFCFALLAVSPASHAQDSDSLTWARANSCERIRDYIARYPSGRYLAQARAQLTARNCPAPQATAPADPCVQARADWAAIATSSDLGVLRAFRNAAPAACAVQRAQADARIAAVQRTVPPARPPQQAGVSPPRVTPPAQSAPRLTPPASTTPRTTTTTQAAQPTTPETGPYGWLRPLVRPDVYAQIRASRWLARYGSATGWSYTRARRVEYTSANGRNVGCSQNVLLTPAAQRGQLFQIGLSAEARRFGADNRIEEASDDGTGADCESRSARVPAETLPIASFNAFRPTEYLYGAGSMPIAALSDSGPGAGEARIRYVDVLIAESGDISRAGATTTVRHRTQSSQPDSRQCTIVEFPALFPREAAFPYQVVHLRCTYSIGATNEYNTFVIPELALTVDDFYPNRSRVTGSPSGAIVSNSTPSGVVAVAESTTRWRIEGRFTVVSTAGGTPTTTEYGHARIIITAPGG